MGAAVLWYTQGDLERAPTRSTARWHSTHARRRHGCRRAGRVSVRARRARLWQRETPRAIGLPAVSKDSARWRFRRASAMRSPGWRSVALATGDAAQAERLLDEATSVLRHAGPWFLTWALYVRAILAVRRGNPDAAIALVRESLTRIRELHDKFAFVYALGPARRGGGPEGRRRLGRADPGCPGRRHRPHRRHGRRQVGARPARTGRAAGARHAWARIGGAAPTRRAARPRSIRC